MYISVKIGQNMMKWPKFHKTGWNLTRGETGGITIPDCVPVQDILAISTGTERN